MSIGLEIEILKKLDRIIELLEIQRQVIIYSSESECGHEWVSDGNTTRCFKCGAVRI